MFNSSPRSYMQTASETLRCRNILGATFKVGFYSRCPSRNGHGLEYTWNETIAASCEVEEATSLSVGKYIVRRRHTVSE